MDVNLGFRHSASPVRRGRRRWGTAGVRPAGQRDHLDLRTMPATVVRVTEDETVSLLRCIAKNHFYGPLGTRLSRPGGRRP